MKNVSKLTIALAGAGLASVGVETHAAIMSHAATKTFASEAVAAAANNQITLVNLAETASSVGTIGVTTPQLTFTLPTGVTFTANPGANPVIASACTVAYAGGGAGSNYVTYNVTGRAQTIGSTVCGVRLSDFSVNGASVLATSGSALSMTALFTGDAGSTGNTVIATGTSELYFTASPTASGLSVSVPPPSNATRFTSSSIGVQTSSPAAVATFGDRSGLLNANGVTTYNFTSTSATITLSGNFSGITSAYLSPASAGSCAATAPTGSVTGSVAAETVTFTVTPTNGANQARTVCMRATGTTLLPAYTGQALTMTQGPTTAVSVGSARSQSYNSGSVTTIPYVIGTGNGFAQYFRVTNPSSTAAPVIAVVTPDAGGSFTGTVVTSLAGGTNTLIPISDINTATGSSLNSPGQRATVSLLSGTGVTAEGMIVNPDSSVIPYTAIKSGNP